MSGATSTVRVILPFAPGQGSASTVSSDLSPIREIEGHRTGLPLLAEIKQHGHGGVTIRQYMEVGKHIDTEEVTLREKRLQTTIAADRLFERCIESGLRIAYPADPQMVGRSEAYHQKASMVGESRPSWMCR